jgi:hypothetical protein
MSVAQFLEPLPCFLDPSEQALLAELDRRAVRALLAKLEATDGRSDLATDGASCLTTVLAELNRRALEALLASVEAERRTRLTVEEDHEFSQLMTEARSLLARTPGLGGPHG